MNLCSGEIRSIFVETIRDIPVSAAIEEHMPFSDIKVELVSSWGDDRDIANQAWVSSTDKEKVLLRTDADVARVVKSVVSLHHQTPKERLWLDYYLTMPIA